MDPIHVQLWLNQARRAQWPAERRPPSVLRWGHSARDTEQPTASALRRSTILKTYCTGCRYRDRNTEYILYYSYCSLGDSLVYIGTAVPVALPVVTAELPIVFTGVDVTRQMKPPAATAYCMQPFMAKAVTFLYFANKT